MNVNRKSYALLSNGDISNDLDGSLTRFSRSRHFWSWISQKVCFRDIIHNLSNGAIFNDLEWPLTRISRSRHFLKSNIGKPARLKDTVTIAQEETIPNIWNGTIPYVQPWLTSKRVARVCQHQPSFLFFLEGIGGGFGHRGHPLLRLCREWVMSVCVCMC